VVVACALRRRSAALGGLAAGVCYGVGDVMSKALLLELPHHPTAAALAGSPLLYATAGAHGLGFVLLQRAFQNGGALASVGAMTAAMNLLPMAAGVLLLGERCGQVPGEPAEMRADDPADLLSARTPVPGVRWRPALPGRHAGQRRHAERPVLFREQLGPASQIGEELVEHPMQGLGSGNPAGRLPDVQDRVNDLAEHLVKGGGRILAPRRAHAATSAGRGPPRPWSQPPRLRHPTSGDLLIPGPGTHSPASRLTSAR